MKTILNKDLLSLVQDAIEKFKQKGVYEPGQYQLIGNHKAYSLEANLWIEEDAVNVFDAEVKENRKNVFTFLFQHDLIEREVSNEILPICQRLSNPT